MHRALILSTLVIAFAGPSLSEESPPASTEAVYACAALNEDAARLACYDEAVGRLQAAEAAGEVTTITKAEVEEVQRDAFGFNMPSIPRLSLPGFGGGQAADDTREIKSVLLPIKEVTVSKRTGLIITLENGQIWRQTESRSVYYSKKKGAKEAEIKRGALGSYRMKLDGGRAFAVKRVE